jgi:hypothetical protein
MKKKTDFTTQDLKQIKAMGLTKRDVEKQLGGYAHGPNYLKLDRPCTPGDGILSIASAQRKKLIRKYEDEASAYSILKFVPASGAASRMFDRWYSAAEKGSFGDDRSDRLFYHDLKKMPFWPLLKQEGNAGGKLKRKDISGLLERIFTEKGLHYGWLPKALIDFHAYPDGEIRTALEEHLVEAACFIRDSQGRCHLHITLSEEHVQRTRAKLREVRKKYEDRFGVRIRVDYSIQQPSTNMIAVNEDMTPFRDGSGRLVFRPGGHGALLQNLKSIDADFIFIKNIDNIVPDNVQKKILPYKRMLGGLALQIQQRIISQRTDLVKGKIRTGQIEACTEFCRDTLNVVFDHDFDRLTPGKKKAKILSFLDRPLRVCGMVRNEGEPGGGPFWVDRKDGTQSLQIVESAHDTFEDPGQRESWRDARYFNPVDMVCCIKDYRGRKFDLEKFVDPDAYLISSKTDKGRKLLAQELPGLWNGGMAYWNTVFVELPVEVFNPVKTVYDLLRPQHRAKRKKKA